MVERADGGPEVADDAAPPVRRRRVLVTGLAVLATLVLVGYCLLLVVPSVLGFQRYVLVGGSMEPTIHRGSLVFDRVAPVDDLHVGDVITYVPPGMTHPLSHRIVHVTHDESGSPVFRTRGDANASLDPWRFTLNDATQARVSFSVPYAGYPLWLLGSPLARLVLIGIPALLIGGVTARRLWQRGGELVAAEQAAALASEPALETELVAELGADAPQDEDVELVRS
jgi:signal peptidase